MNAEKADWNGFLFLKFIRGNHLKSAPLCVLFVFLFSTITAAQDLPKEIRGYKVYQAKIAVKNQADETSEKDKAEAFISVGEPTLADISLAGITLELSAEIKSLAQSGTIDFLTFKDFRVNGLAVEVEEYKQSFEFKKNQTVKLPHPVKIFVGAGEALRGAIGEWRDTKKDWTVTGRAFVFGRFKKYGFKFKRVIPVDVNLKIKNPLKQ